MEGFLQGLPPGFNNTSLRNELDPYMKKLSIAGYSRSVHKSKTTGHIVFLDASHGSKFLDQHGVLTPSPSRKFGKPESGGIYFAPPLPSSERLMLMGMPPACHPSHKEPSDFELRGIRYETEKRESEPHVPRSEQRPVALAPQESMASLLQALLTFQSKRGGPPPKDRVAGIDDARSRISKYCLVYYMLLLEEGLLHVTRSTIGHEIAGSSGSTFKPDLECVDALETELGRVNQLGSLPYTMLFLLKALVTNNYLHPTVVGELARQLVSDFSHKTRGVEPPTSIEAFKKLFQAIECPSPQSDPSRFTVPNIMAYLRETAWFNNYDESGQTKFPLCSQS
ncbi:hypothetical protein B0T14DRAFT_561804 [Immersiella caudata]|uniref:Uncharacterized protein n=1 Tax=Immersiella caudata TaxID=314043 RepID=A0AA39X2M5_9PEZI|nr:hypothetical protein B0T14DRAFT_561804 [Immersiella caudata]